MSSKYCFYYTYFQFFSSLTSLPINSLTCLLIFGLSVCFNSLYSAVIWSLVVPYALVNKSWLTCLSNSVNQTVQAQLNRECRGYTLFVKKLFEVTASLSFCKAQSFRQTANCLISIRVCALTFIYVNALVDLTIYERESRVIVYVHFINNYKYDILIQYNLSYISW